MNDVVELRVPAPKPTGVALLAKGFRPFFVLAAGFAVFGVPFWVLVRANVVTVGEHLLPTVWHAHEMVFGFATAVVGGFLLTAASNWTKRVTAVGGFLALLCAIWIAGRVVTPLGGILPGWLITSVNLAFLPLLIIAIARPVIAARSRRNYGLVVVLVALFVAQAMTHIGALMGSVRWQTAGPRLGVGLITVIMLVIGGRIIPIFTRNATKVEGIRTLPWIDRASILSALAVVLLDLLMVRGVTLILVASVAALSGVARARYWGFTATLDRPLLWVLHVGYAFIPLGFGLRALAVSVPAVADSTALHALTAGAMGTLILGMMTRVSLGHTGRALKAPPALSFAFVLVGLAGLVRVVGPLIPGRVAAISIHVAAGLFALAYGIYLVRIAPFLFRPRPDGRPG